jgi:hypothetical protein
MRPITAIPATASSPKTRQCAGQIGVPDRRGELRQDGWNADLEEGPHGLTQLRHVWHGHQLVHAARRIPSDRKHDDARQYCRDRGAIQSQVQAEDQQRIEDRRRDAGGQRHIHRTPRIAGPAQNAGCRHGQSHDGRRRNNNVQKPLRKLKRFAARAQKMEELSEKRPDSQRRR